MSKIKNWIKEVFSFRNNIEIICSKDFSILIQPINRKQYDKPKI